MNQTLLYSLMAGAFLVWFVTSPSALELEMQRGRRRDMPLALKIGFQLHKAWLAIRRWIWRKGKDSSGR